MDSHVQIGTLEVAEDADYHHIESMVEGIESRLGVVAKSNQDGTYDILAEDTEKRESIDGPSVELFFVPQAWKNDHAIEVDPEGPQHWEVPLEDALVDGNLVQDNTENSDRLREQDRAPNQITK